MRTIDFKQPEGINFQKKLKNETQGGGAGNPIIHTGVIVCLWDTFSDLYTCEVYYISKHQ